MKELESESIGFLILGASGDVGSQLARRLRGNGHGVFLASRGSEHLHRLSLELDAPVREVDATSVAEVEACFQDAVSTLGRIDGVVNCVGSVLLKPAHLTSEDEWNQTIATNLTSAFATVRASAKTMKAGGSVVLMSSAAAKIGLPNHEAIAAAKAGVSGLAQSAAASYAARGLRFNVVAPGLVETKLTKKIWGNERAAATSVALHPLGRLGQTSDIVSMITWLLEPDNSWVTGEVFAIDGGLGSLKLHQRSRS